ncbi:MAG TPA: hypothetical protein VFA31_01915, partial [Candidatus Polarisedimenticolia bacterium]|nr:hypothetical protein [Candidatus Polarisedimenticolia bacterium]
MTTDPGGALPTIRGVSCVLAHTPGLLRYGSKPTRELAKEDATLLPRMRQHLRTFEEAAAYPPNQVFIGNADPRELWNVELPWWKHATSDASATGVTGEVMHVDLQGKKVIAIGERDGVQATAIAAVARSAGAEVLLEL